MCISFTIYYSEYQSSYPTLTDLEMLKSSKSARQTITELPKTPSEPPHVTYSSEYQSSYPTSNDLKTLKTHKSSTETITELPKTPSDPPQVTYSSELPITGVTDRHVDTVLILTAKSIGMIDLLHIISI